MRRFWCIRVWNTVRVIYGYVAIGSTLDVPVTATYTKSDQVRPFQIVLLC